MALFETAVKPGDRAPEFDLADQRGDRVRLADFLGRQHVVLFFYPKDFTPVCTAESCGFRDHYDAFVEAGAAVLGVSVDPPDSHQRFAGKHGLQYKLLTDADGAVRARYGVKPLLGLVPPRATFVIDREGVVRHVFASPLQADRHVQSALATVRGLAR